MGYDEILGIKKAYENLEESLFLKQVNFETRQREGHSQEIQDISGDLSRELICLRRSIREEMNEVVLALLLQQPELLIQYPRDFSQFLVHPECRYIQLPEIPKLRDEFERVRKSQYRIPENPRTVWSPGTEKILEQYTQNDIARKLERAGACKNVKELTVGWVMARALNQLYSLSGIFCVVIDRSGSPLLREFCHENKIRLIQEVRK